MAKKIKNPIEIKAVLNFVDGVPGVSIDEVSIHYGTDCEHGDLGRTGLPFINEPTLLNPVKDFFENAIALANIEEVISPPVDYGPVTYPE